MPCSIRPATNADIPAIRRVAEAVWPVAYRDILTPQQLAYMLELFYTDAALDEQMRGKSHRFFIAEDEGDNAVGFASFSVSNGVAHLHKLYVLPQTQGTGSGAALLRRCEADAARAGATSMQLNVNRHNRAKAFYEKHGYHILLEEDIDIGSAYFMNDYRMERALKNPSSEE